MVFAVRCPNPACRKYMLVEEADRGKVVPCLICKQPIKVPATPVSSNTFSLGLRHQPPALGQQSAEVLRELGYGEAEIEALVASGAVRLDGPMLNSEHERLS